MSGLRLLSSRSGVCSMQRIALQLPFSYTDWQFYEFKTQYLWQQIALKLLHMELLKDLLIYINALSSSQRSNMLCQLLFHNSKFLLTGKFS